MITNGLHSRLTAIAKRFQFLIRAKWTVALVAALFLGVAATPPPTQLPGTVDEQYIQIMALIDRGDALRGKGQADAAKTKYKQAYGYLLNFKRNNPLYIPKAVAYRLAELQTDIDNRPANAEETAPAPKKQPPKLEKSTSTAKSQIKLLDAGAEPKKALRLHPQANDKQTVVVTAKLNMDLPAMGTNGPPKLPTITIPADVTVEKIAPNGDITFDLTLGEGGFGSDGTLPPPALEGAKKTFGSLKGLAVTMVMSSHGSGRVIGIKAPPGAAADFNQGIAKAQEAIATMHNSTPMMALPEEAIGQGAKWEVKNAMVTNGMTIDQTADYQLVSVDGDHISVSKTLDFAMHGTPEMPKNQNATPMAMPAMEISGRLTGTSALDLSKLLPLQANWEGDLTVNMTIKTPKSSMPMSVKVGVNFSLEAH